MLYKEYSFHINGIYILWNIDVFQYAFSSISLGNERIPKQNLSGLKSHPAPIILFMYNADMYFK